MSYRRLQWSLPQQSGTALLRIASSELAYRICCLKLLPRIRQGPPMKRILQKGVTSQSPMRGGKKKTHKKVVRVCLAKVLKNFESAEEATYLQPRIQPPQKELCKEPSYYSYLSGDLVGSSTLICRSSSSLLPRAFS